MQRFIADAISVLGDSGDAADRWSRGTVLFRELGIPFIAVGAAPVHLPEQAIFHSNAPDSMIGDYLGEGIYRVDPWMQLSATRSDLAKVRVQEDLASGTGYGGRPLAELFAEYGVVQASLCPCYGGAMPGGLVLFSQDAESADWVNSEDGESRARMAVALFASLFAPSSRNFGVPTFATMPRLSERECEALLWLAAGLQTAQIADRMGVTAITVSKHFVNARRRLGAKTREQALALALLSGQLSI